MKRKKVIRVGARGLLALGVLVAAPDHSAAQHQAAPGPGSLGVVEFGVACDSTVRAEFDRGIALYHHMTYPVARTVFRAVAERDPDCSLAYWGAAMTLFQPLWPTRPSPSALREGWGLIEEARRHKPSTRREEMFLATGEAFFDPAGEPDYWTRIDRWAAATTRLHAAFPKDREARAFFALSQLAVAERSDTPAEHHALAAAVLRGILEEEPAHPGAVHYTIHANDFAGREHESNEVVRRYGELAPDNPHALHMPTHIFLRLGAWEDVIDGNRRAARAALAQRVGPNGEYVWDEYPHATEYLVYAHLQRGDDDAAREAIRALAATADLEPSIKTAFHLASLPARYALERRAWAEAARIPQRSPSWVAWDQFPWPEAVTLFARGLGAVHSGQSASVEESIEQLERLRVRAAESGEAYFAGQIEILRLEVSAWRAHAAGDADAAVRLMVEAETLEHAAPKHPVTPGAILPASELLGDLYLAIGDPGRALDAYRRSEKVAPGRLNGLLGHARASAALGDREAASGFYRRLLKGAATNARRPAVAEARRFLEEGR